MLIVNGYAKRGRSKFLFIFLKMVKMFRFNEFADCVVLHFIIFLLVTLVMLSKGNHWESCDQLAWRGWSSFQVLMGKLCYFALCCSSQQYCSHYCSQHSLRTMKENKNQAHIIIALFRGNNILSFVAGYLMLRSNQSRRPRSRPPFLRSQMMSLNPASEWEQQSDCYCCSGTTLPLLQHPGQNKMRVFSWCSIEFFYKDIDWTSLENRDKDMNKSKRLWRRAGVSWR